VKVAPLEASTLTTGRLTLRMLQGSDFEEYYELHKDPEVTRYTVRATLDRAEAWRHLAWLTGQTPVRQLTAPA